MGILVIVTMTISESFWIIIHHRQNFILKSFFVVYLALAFLSMWVMVAGSTQQHGAQINKGKTLKQRNKRRKKIKWSKSKQWTTPESINPTMRSPKRKNQSNIRPKPITSSTKQVVEGNGLLNFHLHLHSLVYPHLFVHFLQIIILLQFIITLLIWQFCDVVEVANIHKMMIWPNLSILLILLVHENPSNGIRWFFYKLKKLGWSKF